MTINLLTLDTAGIVTDTASKLYKLQAYYFATQHSQSDLTDSVYSLAYTINKYLNDQTKMALAVKTEWYALIHNYFDQVAVDVIGIDDPLNDNIFYLKISTTVSDGATSFENSATVNVSLTSLNNIISFNNDN